MMFIQIDPHLDILPGDPDAPDFKVSPCSHQRIIMKFPGCDSGCRNWVNHRIGHRTVFRSFNEKVNFAVKLFHVVVHFSEFFVRTVNGNARAYLSPGIVFRKIKDAKSCLPAEGFSICCKCRKKSKIFSPYN